MNTAPQHLLMVALGPVQGFIAQARRTRDLWFGSHILSELGRAAARELVRGGARLVFPALKQGDVELDPCPSPLRPDGKPPLSIPNKLLAEVPAGVDPAVLARSVREAVKLHWRQTADQVKSRCAGLLAEGIDEVWREQIESFLEFTATWVPVGSYPDTRREAERVIAARKNLRDFEPWRCQRGNAPKSSLDGARETVLAAPEQRDPRLVHKYRISKGEQLDAVGLVKRAGAEPTQFVPVVNVAVAVWLECAQLEAPRELGALKSACETLGLAQVVRPDLPCARVFPFDASILFRHRWKAVFEEQGLGSEQQAVLWGRQHVEPLLERLPEPEPYVAWLVADGDRMGAVLDTIQSADAHQAFSRSLSAFAVRAREIVEKQHLGSLIYSGGDDVLAMLPVPRALECADALRRQFEGLMAEACGTLPGSIRPTLSVGIGIGHVMESMGDLIGLGRKALKEAKRERNALAVAVEKRSGARIAWDSGWDQPNGCPVARLKADIELLRGGQSGSRLSTRKVYEIAQTLSRLPNPDDVKDGAPWARLLGLEVRRSLARVRAGEGGIEPEQAGLFLGSSDDYKRVHDTVSSWIARMTVARIFLDSDPYARA